MISALAPSSIGPTPVARPSGEGSALAQPGVGASSVGAAAEAARAVTQADAGASVRGEAASGRDGARGASADGLSEAEQKVVAELKRRDAEVRAHEQAHAQVGGEYAGAPSYEYEVGPDNQRYAVAGEVPIDAAPVPGDPEATIQKMEVVKRAALAPAEPSSADRQVAALADRQRAAAQAELFSLKAAERRGDAPESGDPSIASEAARGYADGRAAQAAEEIVSIVSNAV